jgi:uncharacterized membrane protein YfcA
MSMIQAIGLSLLSVGAFGATTATSYAFDGLVDWRIALLFIGGCLIGGVIGANFATHLSKQRGAFAARVRRGRVLGGYLHALSYVERRLSP